MAESAPRVIRFTPGFQQKLKPLARKYRHIRRALDPVLERSRQDETLGEPISGVGYTVMKLRIKNRDLIS